MVFQRAHVEHEPDGLQWRRLHLRPQPLVWRAVGPVGATPKGAALRPHVPEQLWMYEGNVRRGQSAGARSRDDHALRIRRDSPPFPDPWHELRREEVGHAWGVAEIRDADAALTVVDEHGHECGRLLCR